MTEPMTRGTMRVINAINLDLPFALINQVARVLWHNSAFWLAVFN